MDALMREAGLHEGMGEEEGMARMQEFMARLSQGTHALLDNRSEELTPVDTDVRDITGAKEEGNMLFAKKDFAGALAAYAKAASYAKEEISPAAEAVFCAVCCNQARVEARCLSLCSEVIQKFSRLTSTALNCRQCASSNKAELLTPSRQPRPVSPSVSPRLSRSFFRSCSSACARCERQN